MTDEQDGAFSYWLRTGRLPTVRTEDGVELKFNPWHDPTNGRFTFAGAGQFFGPGSRGYAGDEHGGRSKISGRSKPLNAGSRSLSPAKTSRRTRHDGGSTIRDVSVVHRPGSAKGQPRRSSSIATEFLGGVAEGASEVVKGTLGSIYSAATTNPLTTIRDVEGGIARAIDRAIAAEDTPARIQLSRAAQATARASPRDVGRVVGSTAGSAALAVAPGAALARASTLRRLRRVQPRQVHQVPEAIWIREKLKSDKPWKAYNDAAPGARPGYAPSLYRTLPNGLKRPVKFDGIEGGAFIDRKWKVVDAPHARAQLLRQSRVLAENGATLFLEVPNTKMQRKAFKLLKKMRIHNIKVRIVAP
jgi:hypothetical protein